MGFSPFSFLLFFFLEFGTGYQDGCFDSSSCGQTTVNEKALIHYITSVNDNGLQTPLKCFKTSKKYSTIRPSNLI